MALETEDQDEEASEVAEKEAQKEKAQKEEANGESDEDSDAPIDLDDGVDMVPNTEKVVLGMASSSSSSSSSPSSVDPDELELTGADLEVELTDWKKEDPDDKVEFMKRIPMRSPALTTPGDISSTDSDSSSDSPVREIAGEISDGEGTGPGRRRRHACIVPIRRKPLGTGLRRVIPTTAVPIGLDEVGDGGNLDEVCDGGDVASDDDVVL